MKELLAFSIIKEIAEKDWWSADWPNECRLCGTPYGEAHYSDCLIRRAKEALKDE